MNDKEKAFWVKEPHDKERTLGLISADALLMLAERRRDGVITKHDIEIFPKITISPDAVVVVRCKDCKHWVREYDWQCHECTIFNGCYETSGYPTEPDDYCSYGERKDNE